MTNDKPKDKKWINCAIYTRKSTAEGPDKEFTSLDAQRESAENYIKSQRHEGWTLLPEHYDDGGFTGANIERPALSKLLNDIKTGQINCVVVYKVDRLSRSLLDFSQLLEFFDKHSVTFVSVTQQFNTNTSMGRLTLNILLSFAQFEREIISERTKDKMGAARRRGQWMGGKPPFGYRRVDKKLVVEPEEASIVQEINKLYIEGKSLLQVAQTLNDRGLRTRSVTMRSGKAYGGKKYDLTQIQHMIKNVLYIGKVKYAGKIYDGQQPAIIDEETFKKAQEQLKINRVERRVFKNTVCTGLLSQRFHCSSCRAVMVHTYTLKPNQHKYRYYLCTTAQKKGYRECPTGSLNAQAIENAVIGHLKLICADTSIREKMLTCQNEIDAITSSIWDALIPEEKRKTLKAILERVEYDHAAKKLWITLKGIPERFELNADLKVNQPKNRWHKEIAIKQEAPIVRNLILAHQINRLMDEGRITDLKQASVWLNMSPARVSQIVTLNFLSTEIKESLLTFPAERIAHISDNTLRNIASEIDWQKQTSLWREALQ
jgi:site-specific DNA recombinase